jgi:hypothetical protein
MEGLTGLRRPEQVAKLRGLSVHQVLGLDLKQENGNTEAAPAPETAEAALAAEEPSDG